MNYAQRSIGVRAEVAPELAEYIPPSIHLDTSLVRRSPARKSPIYTSDSAKPRTDLLIPHNAEVIRAIRHLNEEQGIPFSEYDPLLVVDVTHDLAVSRVIVNDVDDLDGMCEFDVLLTPGKGQGWIPCDAMLIFRLECHAINKDRKHVIIYAGSAYVPLRHDLAGKTLLLKITDISDPPESKDYPECLSPGGVGFEKGVIKVHFPADKFKVMKEDFGPSHPGAFQRQRDEEMVDALILRNLAAFMDLGEIKADDGRPALPPVIEGIEPMQAPVYRTLVTKLPGGAWAMLKHGVPTPISSWIRYLETALYRYSRTPVAYGTDLWHADTIPARQWLTRTIDRQFEEWGPKQNRVHPEFHLACMVVMHALCVYDTSLFYTDDHTNENRRGAVLAQDRVKITNNQQKSLEEGSGDCDTMSGSINRFGMELQTYAAFDGEYIDNMLLKKAQQVARLFVFGMPHGAVSTKNILEKPSEDMQNHMFALAYPRSLFFWHLQQAARDPVLSRMIAPYRQKLIDAERRFGALPKWHTHLQMMLLEGTGPLNPFGMPTWLSACSWLYADNPASIPEHEQEHDMKRALQIARREAVMHELEAILVKDMRIVDGSSGTAMMWYDDPTMTFGEMARQGWNASHFYKVAVGFQTAELADADIPIIELHFTTEHNNSTMFGATYFDLVTAPFQRNLVTAPKPHRVRSLVGLRPTVFMSAAEMRQVRTMLQLEPWPLPLDVIECSEAEMEVVNKMPMKEPGTECVETMYFVRVEDLPRLIAKLETEKSGFIRRVHVRATALGASSFSEHARFVVADVTIGASMPAEGDLEKAIPMKVEVAAQLAELRAVLTGTS